MKTVPLLDDEDRAALRDRFGERARFDEALAPHTWWKIGGPADAFVTVATGDELAYVLRHVFRRRLPMFVLGSGSNLLVGDGGIRGIVLRLEGEFTALDVRAKGDEVVVEANALAEPFRQLAAIALAENAHRAFTATSSESARSWATFEIGPAPSIRTSAPSGACTRT